MKLLVSDHEKLSESLSSRFTKKLYLFVFMMMDHENYDSLLLIHKDLSLLLCVAFPLHNLDGLLGRFHSIYEFNH